MNPANLCPDCGAVSRVSETRGGVDGALRRRRRCTRKACGRKWSTVEIVRMGNVPVTVDQMTARRLRDRVREILADLDAVLDVKPPEQIDDAEIVEGAA